MERRSEEVRTIMSFQMLTVSGNGQNNWFLELLRVATFPRVICDSIVLDMHQRVHMFDGKCAHEVLPFDGDRYSVVFDTTPDWQAASDPLHVAERMNEGLRRRQRTT